MEEEEAYFTAPSFPSSRPAPLEAGKSLYPEV